MPPTLDRSLTVYKTHIVRDSLQGEVATLEQVISPVFAGREDLSGRELFEAQKLKYDEPRKYVMLDDDSISQGMFLEEGSELFVIHSIQRRSPSFRMMVCLCSRRRDLETSS